MSVAKYDIAGMKSAASKIRAEMGNYEKEMNKMNTTVESTRNFYKDDRQKQFITKYDDMKETMGNMKKLMENYATFLEEAAQSYERVSKIEI